MHHRSLLRSLIGLAALLTAALAVSAASAGTGTAASPGASDNPRFTTVGGVDPQFLSNARTIPHFTFQYRDPQNGVTYPITMVGSDPRTSNSDTVVHSVIIPLKINLVAAGQDTSVLDDFYYPGFHATPLTKTFDGGSRVADVLASPIFARNAYPRDMGGDRAQYGDAFMRSQFDKIGSGYHVTLKNDATFATQTIDVPAHKGIAYNRAPGLFTGKDAVAGIVQDKWFSEKLQNLMNALGVDATTVPIFLTDNVMLYGFNYADCCTIGYHGAGMPIGYGSGSANTNGNAPVQTFIYSAWTKPGTYSGFYPDYSAPAPSYPKPTRGIADIHALSHEVAEWLDDPYVNNAVQPWLTPTAPQYGCSGFLETGDPVVGVWFPLGGNTAGSHDGFNYYGQYHPEENVFAQWFGRGGVEAAGFHSYTNRLTFMGSRTTSIGGPYADFANYANGC
ncbi:MAG: hypothetical protein QOE36_1041 [Gaiellaceae bacterium]|nr:hypothetical protein [Gaiellaceae bacterium]